MVKPFLLRHKTKFTLVALVGLALPAMAFLGVPGLPQIVWDPVVHTAITILTGVTGTGVAVDSATLTKVKSIERIAEATYTRIHHGQRSGWLAIRGLIPPSDRTVDSVGETTGWRAMMDGGVEIASVVWPRATVALKANPAVWALNPVGSSNALAAVATVETIDGSSTRCLEEIARTRENAALNNPAVMSLNEAILNDTDAFNGGIGQQNIANAAQAQSNAEARTQTAMQACLEEAVILSNKATRDHIATAMNAQTEAMQEQTLKGTTWDGGTTFSTPIP